MRIAVTVAVCAVLLVGCSGSEGEAGGSPGDAGKQQIKEFWTTFRAANAKRLEGEFEEAAAGYRASLALNPKHEESLYYLGASLEQSGEYRFAAETYERLLEINPSSGRTLTQLAAMLSTPAPGGRVDYERTGELIERAIALNPEQAGPFLLKGKLKLNQGSFGEAVESFEIARRFGSAEGDAWAGYALLLDGRRAEATGHFKQAVDIYRRERGLASAGVSSEGDVLPEVGKPLSALDRAGLMAMYFLGGFDEPRPGERAFPEELAPRILAEQRAIGAAGTVFFSGSGIPPQAPPESVAAGDYSADGLPDHLVMPWRKMVRLMASAGGGNHLDATEEAGLSSIRATGFSAVFFDYDNDLRPDLLITAHAPFEEVIRCRLDANYKATRNTPRLFRNQSDGTFKETTTDVGLHRSYGTLKAIVTDFDNDGWKDVLLVNGSLDALRLEPSVLLRNIRGQRFEEWARYPATKPIRVR